MKGFLKYTLASILGIIIGSLLLFFIFLAVISTIVSNQESSKEIKSSSILMLKLNHQIVERTYDDPFENFNPLAMEIEHREGLTEIIEAINRAKTNDNIKGIYLNLSVISAGSATIEEIRNALKDFKSSGKFILAYADFFTQKAYYLASVADYVYLNPAGELALNGMSANLSFFKRALDKLGIEAQIIRHGKYKSAIEPFSEEKMSTANREQLETLIGSVWGNISSQISIERNISLDTLNMIIDNLDLIKSVDAALEARLIDGVKYKDEIIDQLKELSGVLKNKELELVSVSDINSQPKNKSYKGLAKNKLAVIYAYGDVVMGNEGEGTISSDRISRAIRAARQDSSVKAIVFRVNSGGGSALASEVIWRELKLAADTKPVVGSMGDLAASGGYYILAAADTILASPNTITGSIGVFGMIPNMQKFFNDKIGVTFDVVKSNKHSDMATISRPLDNTELSAIQHSVEGIYKTFVTHVAEGRNSDFESIDAIGQGRVWSGVDAKRIGLIDDFGGLTDAIRIAAGMADIKEYRITELPKIEDPITLFFKKMGVESRMKIMQKELGENFRYYKILNDIQNYQGIQARLPFEIIFE